MAKWNPEEVNESGKVYPEVLLRVKITEQKDIVDDKGRMAIQVHSRILEPKDLRQQPYSFRFIMGMTAETAAKFELDEDLEAQNPETWTKNPSAGRYKSYLKAIGVACTGDTDEEAEDAVGKVVLIQNKVQEGKYNNVAAMYPDGEQPASATSNVNGLAKRSTAKKARPVTEEEKQEASDEWDD